jgi:hypothetical protein
MPLMPLTVIGIATIGERRLAAYAARRTIGALS